MKNITIMTLCASLALAGCTQEKVEDPTGPDGLMQIEAVAENIVTDGESLKTVWAENDVIKVFTAKGSAEFRFKSSKEDGSCLFEGDAPVEEKYFALYPSMSDASADATGKITVTLPHEQKCVAGTFDKNTNIAAGVSSDGRFQFRNVCSLLKFEILSEGVTSVTVSGNGDENLAGKVEVVLDEEGIPSYTVSEGRKQVILTPEGSSFAPGIYYCTVLPQTVKGGFTFLMTGNDGSKAVQSSQGDATLARSAVFGVEEKLSADWLPYEEIIADANAVITEGTVIKGTHVNIDLSKIECPYVVSRVYVNDSQADIEIAHDGQLPEWVTLESATSSLAEGIWRHEVKYTVIAKPTNHERFLITYAKDSHDDNSLFVIGFMKPYPGTPLPCLGWGDNIYAPVHVNQSTYLANNTTDKAFFAGEKTFTLNESADPMVNDKAVNPCPEGWTPLDDKQAKDMLEWVTTTDHLLGKDGESVYLYKWYNAPEASALRILAGYARTKHGPAVKDLACFGTWPHCAWVLVNDDLTIGDTTFDDQWPIDKGYAVPYRCIRAQEGWKN